MKLLLIRDTLFASTISLHQRVIRWCDFSARYSGPRRALLLKLLLSRISYLISFFVIYSNNDKISSCTRTESSRATESRRDWNELFNLLGVARNKLAHIVISRSLQLSRIKQIKMLIMRITRQVPFPFIILAKREEKRLEYHPERCFRHHHHLVALFFPSQLVMNVKRHERKVINSVGHAALRQLRAGAVSLLAADDGWARGEINC